MSVDLAELNVPERYGRPRRPRPLPFSASIFRTVVRDGLGREKYRSRRRNLRTTAGIDWQAAIMGGGAVVGSAATGTSTTAPTATTATLDGVAAPGSTTAYNGRIIVMAGVFGVVLSNTNVSSPVLTIDLWHDATNPANTGSTPAAGRWVILPGQAPIQYLALTSTAITPAAGDTTLSGELTTNGFARAFGTYSHTGGSASFSLAKTFNCSGGSTTINGEAVFTGQNGAGGGDVMAFESTEPSPPTLISGDTLSQTVTINYASIPFSLLAIGMATSNVERVAAIVGLGVSAALAVFRWRKRPA